MADKIDVYKAITKVAQELSKAGIGKDQQNKQQGFKFRGIDDVYNALAPILSKNNLCIIPRVLSREVTEKTTKNGGVLFYVAVEVEFDMVSAIDGSVHTAKTYGEAMDSGDKATNKAMSAAYKYLCFQTFCIPTEGDNDADSTTHDLSPPEPLKSADFEAEVDKHGTVKSIEAWWKKNATRIDKELSPAEKGKLIAYCKQIKEALTETEKKFQQESDETNAF